MAHAVPLGLSHIVLCTGCGAIRIRDIEAFTESYMVHAVPLGLSKKIVKRSLCNSGCAIGIVKNSFSKEVYVIVAVPLGFGMLRISKKAYGTRCAIGIRCKLLPKDNKYLTVRNLAARFGYFSVFC